MSRIHRLEPNASESECSNQHASSTKPCCSSNASLSYPRRLHWQGQLTTELGTQRRSSAGQLPSSLFVSWVA